MAPANEVEPVQSFLPGMTRMRISADIAMVTVPGGRPPVIGVSEGDPATNSDRVARLPAAPRTCRVAPESLRQTRAPWPPTISPIRTAESNQLFAESGLYVLSSRGGA